MLTSANTTSRHLPTRACEELGISVLTGIAIKTAFSSINDYLLTTGHNINLDDFLILLKSHLHD